jgi:predicted dehydrogenase
VTYRAAIIGCGRIGADINPPGVGSSRLGCHAAAYASSRRARLAAACDPDKARRDEARRRWGIPHVYADAAEMLERETPEIVSICTPAGAGREIVGNLLSSESVKAVLVEKPLASTLEEADALLAQSAASRVASAVNYVRRYASSYTEVAAAVRAGSLGRVQLVRGIYTKGILNNGTHLIDLLRMFFGEVQATEIIGEPVDSAIDPTVSCRLRFGDVDATIHGLDHTACSIFEVDIVGTRGRVTFTDLGHRINRWTVDDTMSVHGFRQLSPNPDVSDTGLATAIASAIENLMNCVEGAAKPLCTFADARAALELAMRIREMAAARHVGVAF